MWGHRIRPTSIDAIGVLAPYIVTLQLTQQREVRPSMLERWQRFTGVCFTTYLLLAYAATILVGIAVIALLLEACIDAASPPSCLPSASIIGLAIAVTLLAH